ncbi:lactate permease [Spinactinospora alkalitolerans]|uniref:L-lactate permease n=1 Tax=Spinactinospora alkalitolerans TaxID=687207 RepID=A0A852TTT3_9ACTN|nr:L-lactate permease [Spinactinospora alkalitolerans]NYE47856.1 lactate permease [Spinactinospora alkalitolerans]
MTLDLWSWLLALSPLALLLVLMIVRNWGAAEAGALSWLATASIAALAFGMSLRDIGMQSVKGAMDALTIVYIIWPAILIYEITREADAFRPLQRGITRLLPHPLLQVMAFGWVFASFLQGITGFGVPIAVCAPLLVSIGVRPVHAVFIALIGHAWNNTFGTLAAAWVGLKQVTDLSPGEEALTALQASVLLWIVNIAAGLVICWMYGRARGVSEGLTAVALISLAHGGLGLVLSQWDDTLNGFLAALAGFVLIFGLGRLPMYRRSSAVRASPMFAGSAPSSGRAGGTGSGEDAATGTPSSGGRRAAPATGVGLTGGREAEASTTAREMPLGTAFLPYTALLGITLVILLIPPIERTLGGISVGLGFPPFTTGLGYATPAETSEMAVFTHAGTFLLAAAVVTYLCYARMRYLAKGAWKRALARTADKAIGATIAVLALVSMAAVMQGSGQASTLAQGVADWTGGVYILLAPFIGLFGTFITGSNLSGNLLFGPLQQTTATAAGLSGPAVLSGQTAGGALGAIISPSKVLLGTTTAGVSGREGEVLRMALPVTLLLTAVIGAVVFFFA